MEPGEQWYGEKSAHVETDELLIDDSVPVFDRARFDGYNNPHWGVFDEDVDDWATTYE